jgi:hypothetical protein
MESTRRDPGVPKGKPGEKDITRRVRIKGPPREPRLIGVRRVPRSAAGGAIMLGVLIWFFAGFTDEPLKFLLGLAALVSVTMLAVWGLAQAPIRATFDQRWRPKRRIETLDTTAWKALAAELGAKYRPGRLPRIDGVLDGVPFRLAFFQRGSARTVAVARLTKRVKRVRAFPRRAEFTTKQDVTTGDREFDRAYHVQSPHAASVKRLFTPEARLRVLLAAPESVEAKRKSVVVRQRSFTADPERLRALLRAATALAT